MRVSDILSPECISLELDGATKEEIIDSLLDLLATTGKLNDRSAARECILARESKMSTGIQDGIAIPHGKTSAADELIVCFGRKSEGVDFDALDGELSYLFFMTLSPVESIGSHIELLAEISRVCNEKEVREKLMLAENSEQVLEILAQ